ncbi:MAG: hypothetical protein JWN85_1406 [Gammaproteobacteria bacterium]|nr:hypothetical protein [Gammaproteobacteria bacterium]
MKTSSWFDALALLVISLMSITVGAMTDTSRDEQARTAQATPGNR